MFWVLKQYSLTLIIVCELNRGKIELNCVKLNHFLIHTFSCPHLFVYSLPCYVAGSSLGSWEPPQIF